MRVGVVILHYRFWPGVSQTLEAVEAQSLAAAVVVLVDNGSAEGDMEALLRAHPEVRVVAAPDNGGYAHGMNLGRRALPEVEAVLFLTHECLLAPDALAELAARLEQAPDVGMVGPLLGWRSRPAEVWSGGGGLGRRTGRPFHHQQPALMADWGSVPVRRRWLDGAALLVRTDVLDRVGGFDEGYFLYCEEVELAVRTALAGWGVECVPAARAWQEPGMAPPYLETRNLLRLLARSRGLRRYLLPALLDTAGSVLRGLSAARGSSGRRVALLRWAGARDALLGRLDRDRSLAR